MKAQDRKLPCNMLVKKKRVPISGRVLEETKAVLELHAEKNGMSLTEIVGHVLDDYVVWLVQELKKKDKPTRPKKKTRST